MAVIGICMETARKAVAPTTEQASGCRCVRVSRTGCQTDKGHLIRQIDPAVSSSRFWPVPSRTAAPHTHTTRWSAGPIPCLHRTMRELQDAGRLSAVPVAKARGPRS